MHDDDDDDDRGATGVTAKVGSLTELASSVEAKAEAKTDRPPVDLVEEIQVTFRGVTHTITSTVPTVQGHIEIGKLCGQKSAPVPFAMLPPETQMLLQYTALITYSVKNRPKWLDEVLLGHMAEPIFAIGREVARHHEEWFRAQAGVDSLGIPKPIVAVTSRLGTRVQAP